MSEKLLFLKNVLEQVEQLNIKEQELKQAKDAVQLTGNFEVKGQVTIGDMTISLHDLNHHVPATISSNLKMVLSQYIDHLMTKNAQSQQDLLSNIEIAHMGGISPNTAPSTEDVKKKIVEDVSVTEAVQDPLPIEKETRVSAISNEAPVEKAEVRAETPLPSEEKTFVSNEKLSKREEASAKKEKRKKMIAEAFYMGTTGEHVQAKTIQERIMTQFGVMIDIEEINDVAWILIAQDVLEFYYETTCSNGHTSYQQPPLERKNSCSTCHSPIGQVQQAYKKMK